MSEHEPDNPAYDLERSFVLPEHPDHPPRFDDPNVTQTIYDKLVELTIHTSERIKRLQANPPKENTEIEEDGETTADNLLKSGCRFSGGDVKFYKGPKARHPKTPGSPLAKWNKNNILNHVQEQARERARQVFEDIKERLSKMLAEKFSKLAENMGTEGITSSLVIPKSEIATKWHDVTPTDSSYPHYSDEKHPRRIFHKEFYQDLEALWLEFIKDWLGSKHANFSDTYKIQDVIGYEDSKMDNERLKFELRIFPRIH